MKNILLKSMAVASLFAVAATVNAEDIPGAAEAKAGQIGRHEDKSGVNEWLDPENGVYGIHTFAADENDWDSQFFIVIADENLAKGTPVSIKFDYRKAAGSGEIIFNAQGHRNPHDYSNNDGWDKLTATEDWQTYEADIEVSSEMRTFAVNASIARNNGTLYMRNISIQVNYEDAVVTKTTTADEAVMEEAPVVEIPVAKLLTEVDYTKIGGDTDVAGATFISREEHGRFTTVKLDADSVERACGGAQFVQSTVKMGDANVFAFRVDTNDSKWGGTCLTQLFVNLESVSKTIAASKEVILSYDFKTDLVNAAAGTFNLMSSYNTGTYSTGGAPTNEWQTKADTVVIRDTLAFDHWEFHLGKSKPAINYDVFLKSIKVIADGKVLINSDDLTPVAGYEIKDWAGQGGEIVAVEEVAAINAYVANGVLYASEAVDVVIYNISGVAVKVAKNVTTLNVADLKSGLYIAKVGNKAIKFVK